MISKRYHPDHSAWARTATAAVLLCLGLTQPALATVVTRQANVTLNALNIESYDLDVNLDGRNDFTFTAALVLDPILSVGFAVVDFPFASGNGVVIDASTGDGFPAARRLAAGNTVSASNTYSGPNDQGNLFFFTTFDPPSGNFGEKTGFLGLRFDTAGGTHYGFAEVTVNSINALNNPLGLTLGLIGYNDTPGQPVQIAAVPEPAGLPLFGIGALGLMAALRKGRRGAAPAQVENG